MEMITPPASSLEPRIQETINNNGGTVVAKSVAMCVLFTASMTLGSLPLVLKKTFKWKADTENNYVQILLCLGGGVLLCTTFMHLLPEVSEKIRYLDSQDIHYAELLMCIGFFAMYFFEECIHFYMHRKIAQSQQHGQIKYNSKLKSSPSEIKDIEVCNNGDNNEDEIKHHHSYGTSGQNEHEHKHFVAVQDQLSVFRGLFVIFGLSIHELFEGLAVGLESSNKNVWYMFGAVTAHKLVIAFCIGVELVTSKLKYWLVLVYIFTFAVVSPLGIGIGLILSEKRKYSTPLPSILLQGLASGSLLYVVFFEILTANRKSGIKQFFAVLSGFILMFAITYLE